MGADQRTADPVSRRWVEQLHAGHPRHDDAVERLHDLLRRAARHELRRRRGGLAAQELDDLGDQCADDALVKVLARIDGFRGLRRFTTSAYKFPVFEVSGKLAAYGRRGDADELDADGVADALAPRPGEVAERREQLAALRRGIESGLTPRQREVFVAIALDEVPIDALAARLGSNRNAVYKN